MADDYSLPRCLTEEEISEIFNNEESFVVMGALTECHSGRPNAKVQLRTEDTGTEDGTCFKMYNVDRDKEKNFVDEGISLDTKTGSVSSESIFVQRYNPCTVCEKCEPDFLDSWFEPSETVRYSEDKSLVLREYYKTSDTANTQMIETMSTYYKSIGENETLEWYENIPFISEDKKKRNKEKDSKREQFSKINPSIGTLVVENNINFPLRDKPFSRVSSRTDIHNSVNTLRENLDKLGEIDPSFKETDSYKKAESTVKEAEEKLSTLDTQALLDEDGKKHYFPLLKKSVLICKKGGIIYITDNGQRPAIIEKKIKEMKAEFPDCYHAGLEERIKEYPYMNFKKDQKNYTLQARYNAEKSMPKSPLGSKYDSYPKWVENSSDGDNVYAEDFQILDGLNPLTYVNSPKNIFGTFDSREVGDATAEDISKIFNARPYSRENNYASFSQAFIDECELQGINPFYVLAAGQTESTFLTNPSKLGKVYNFFGAGAYVHSGRGIYENGKIFAENEGWTSAELALVGGENVRSSVAYFKEEWGDRPNFYAQRYADSTSNISNQYATAANMASLKGNVMGGLIQDAGIEKTISGTFMIPVYEGACSEEENAFKKSVYSSKEK